jgi:hypothetical protein
MREQIRRVVAGSLRASVVSTAILLALLSITSAAKDFAPSTPSFDPAKLDRQVLFPGIGEPVRVMPIIHLAGVDPQYDATKLPAVIVEKIIRARDRNAFWLLCDARRDYSSIAYTYFFGNNAGLSARCSPVEGKYDRGVNFKVPSEYLLYQSDLALCEFKDEDGYFKVITPPTPMPEERYYSNGIPTYIEWANSLDAAWADNWMNLRTILVLDEYRMKKDFVNGCELWFKEPDMRLEKEIITEPIVQTAEDGSTKSDFSKVIPVTEVQYLYIFEHGGESDYPGRVTVLHDGNESMNMTFIMADGFWMLHSGKLFTGEGEDRNAFGFYTTGIVVKH